MPSSPDDTCLQTASSPRSGSDPHSAANGNRWSSWERVAEIALITLLLFIYGGSAAPNVNEAHYLGKAKHVWDGTFCPNDFFYASDDAHTVFFYTFGWLTKFFSLATTAWIGRFVGWWLLATAWQGLSYAIIPVRAASVLSASLWLVLIQQTQMSGEWVAGGIEAKVVAYAFVLGALHAIVRSQWTRAWVMLGIASAFHVLVGGWAVVMAGFGYLSLPSRIRPPWQIHIVGCFLGGLVSLLGLLPALRLNAGVDPAVASQAAAVYVFQRLSHHLLLRDFASDQVLRHMLITMVFLMLFKAFRHDHTLRRLFGFCAGATLLLIVGAGLDAALGNSISGASLLRFYWFRASDVFLPVAVSLGALSAAKRYFTSHPRLVGIALVALTCVLVTNACSMTMIARRQPIPPADWQGGIRWTSRLSHWREACDWVRDNLANDAVFLTPTSHQTFKWYAHRSEVVTWKDVPQDSSNLLEWSRRLKSGPRLA